jgi:hypothetical protein
LALFNTLRHIDILLAPVVRVSGTASSRSSLRHMAFSAISRFRRPVFAAAAAIAAPTDWVAGMARRMAAVFLRQIPLSTVALPAAVSHATVEVHQRSRMQRFKEAVSAEGPIVSGIRRASGVFNA